MNTVTQKMMESWRSSGLLPSMVSVLERDSIEPWSEPGK